ncbi:uncharacterized protein LOC122511053 [Leptopilina heterotoma]|uniref:uncharacterized protein LOC122511053 n=1 Tax=Leptopilina heterotoma TaxID=63436 RepID=UPI001CA9BBD1|nr:uncharacterized protein LOC122511053 [Leptopilina heterotoma]
METEDIEGEVSPKTACRQAKSELLAVLEEGKGNDQKQWVKREVGRRKGSPLYEWDYVSTNAPTKTSPPKGAELLPRHPPPPTYASPLEGIYEEKPVINRRSHLPRLSPRPPLPIILEGRMFGGLDPIPTVPRLDPPPGVCHNCWRKGHEVPKCPSKLAKFCKNCGRREVILTDCPRCARVNRLIMEERFGKKQYEEFRQQREKYYKLLHRTLPRETTRPELLSRSPSPAKEGGSKSPNRSASVSGVDSSVGPSQEKKRSFLDELERLERMIVDLPLEIAKEMKLQFWKEFQNKKD